MTEREGEHQKREISQKERRERYVPILGVKGWYASAGKGGGDR